MKKLKSSILGMVLFCFAFQAQANTSQDIGTIPFEQLKLFAQIFEQIKQEYVKPVSDQKLIDLAIKGMVSSLDPHSSFLTKEEYQELQEQTKGSFVGLGIEITSEGNQIKIISPIEDTPAFYSGLRPGDLITRIDDTPVAAITLNKAVKMMRGKPGTRVTLLIYRKTEDRLFPVTITRAVIKIESVKAKMLTPDYAYIRITSFQERTITDLAKQLNQLGAKQPHLKGLILDLRNNGGGLLQSAISVATAFLPPNSVVVSTNGQLPEAKQVFKANFFDYQLPSLRTDPFINELKIFKKVPIVVLTNAYTASASEIVAGALKDHHRATIMGKTTFGKGSVQTVKPLDSQTALRLTTAYYYTPNGESIQNTGITPDINVDQYPDGDPDDVLATREADLINHLANTQDPNENKKLKAREEKRIEQIRLLEEMSNKTTRHNRQKERIAMMLKMGTLDDFMVKQALNQLQGKPVIRSKSIKPKNAK